MTQTLGYRGEGEIVTLTMTRSDYATLLTLYLGIAGGSLDLSVNPAAFSLFLALANRLNAGNPNWTPYEIPPPEAATPVLAGSGAPDWDLLQRLDRGREIG